VRAGLGFIASIVLHTALFAALLTLRNAGDPSAVSAPQFVRVSLVQIDGGTESTVEAPAIAGSGSTIESPTDSVEPTAPGDSPRVAEALPEADAQIEFEADNAIDPDTEVDSNPDDDADADVVELLVEDASDETEPPAEPIIEIAVTDPSATKAAVSVPAPPETASIPPSQRSMLDRKIAKWADDFDEIPAAEPGLAWVHDDQQYSATLTRLPSSDSMGIEQVVVAVSTERDGSRWSTELRLKRLPFSSFAQFVDRWDPNVQIHDDRIDGRFHSNSEIFVSRSGSVHPEFHGKVTTARDVNTSRSAGRVRSKDVFLGGLETGVKKIMLPKRFSLFPSEPDPGTDTRVQPFAADARITFYADGSYGWQPVGATTPEQRVTLTNEPHYLVGADDVTLYVRGIVNGTVLVYSPEKIVIEDDLTYAEHPRMIEDADDYLGLVSDANVEIAGPDTTGPGDVTVHASIYAKRRFVVRNYSASERAALFIYGSVAAGSVSATEPRFRTELEFDDRLENLRPPSFPMTDRYELAAWDSSWTVEPLVQE
jgi:hypothetical protein